jgi:hypothetical protein
MIKKPCYFYGSSGLDICKPFGCLESAKWSSCAKGRLSKNFRKKDLENLNPEEQAKLKKARRISKEIVEWAKNSKVQPYEPAFIGQLTKIIKRNL